MTLSGAVGVNIVEFLVIKIEPAEVAIPDASIFILQGFSTVILPPSVTESSYLNNPVFVFFKTVESLATPV